MIPKIIHYVWLGENKLSPSAKHCINSWRHYLPDYEIKCWNENNFDINCSNWTKQAYKHKKYSLVSDYIRHWAIYNMGGVYFDTDVEVYRSLDVFMKLDFFSAVEYYPNLYSKYKEKLVDSTDIPYNLEAGVPGFNILAAAFGASKGNEFIKDCLQFFDTHSFVRKDGTLFTDYINPQIMANLLIKYGFRYRNEKQILHNGQCIIFPSNVFASDRHQRTSDSYLMHWNDSSWIDKSSLSWIRKLSLWLQINCPSIFRK